MTPGTVILLGAGPYAGLAEGLRARGLAVLAPEPADPPSAGHRFTAGAALAIGAARPEPPLVLVGAGDAGPLLPAVGLAQRAAHRAIGAYVFLAAALPAPAGDWPDAPCAYLAAVPDDPGVRAAGLRAWPAETAGDDLAASLASLLADL